ncbi:MAG: hypothetical protein GXY76_13985 [Chloroflexi bacterium]|nr:hypothetical protein [Chloroflexota bacterium]
MDFTGSDDELALVFLYLETCKQYHVARTCPHWDPDCLDRLYEQGYIAAPGLGGRVVITEEGRERASQLFLRFFGKLQF